jgi:mannosyl-oligosaccharide alpha-1,2-mannosidase
MGLQDDFAKAKEWIENKFDLRESGVDLSVFETNIRFVGGLLSAYALSKDQVQQIV